MSMLSEIVWCLHKIYIHLVHLNCCCDPFLSSKMASIMNSSTKLITFISCCLVLFIACHELCDYWAIPFHNFAAGQEYTVFRIKNGNLSNFSYFLPSFFSLASSSHFFSKGLWKIEPKTVLHA